jgi:hypothetical protein
MLACLAAGAWAGLTLPLQYCWGWKDKGWIHPAAALHGS